MVGDATGEYRGTSVRDDAALNAWLAKRPAEAALEPDLPIIDPHHHFRDSPRRGHYLRPELLVDNGGGHDIVSTVFLECRAMYRKEGPREMAALDEIEFVTGIATMSASGAGLVAHDIWVTPTAAAERWPAGDYWNQSPSGQGLPAWTEQDRPLADRPITVRHSFGHNHIVRPEDFPVQPVMHCGFLLQPFAVFDCNPTLEIPPATSVHGCCA